LVELQTTVVTVSGVGGPVAAGLALCDAGPVVLGGGRCAGADREGCGDGDAGRCNGAECAVEGDTGHVKSFPLRAAGRCAFRCGPAARAYRKPLGPIADVPRSPLPSKV